MRIALIGFGKWGRNYLSAVNESRKARVTQILVRNPERVITAPFMGSTVITSNLEEIECDAAIVATHPASTIGYSEYFLRKNIPVMLEKPAGLSFVEAVQLQNTALKHPVPLLVSHQHLFSNVYQELRARVSEDEKMQILTAAGNVGPFRDYSFVWDYAPHDIAMILGLKPSTPKLLSANIESSADGAGQCAFKISFEDGSIAKTMIWNNRTPKTRIFKVRTQRSVYVYDGQNAQEALNIDGEKTTVSYTPPLTNAVAAFIGAVDYGKANDYRFGSGWAVNIAYLIDQIEYSS